jgi:hypothetical protein
VRRVYKLLLIFSVDILLCNETENKYKGLKISDPVDLVFGGARDGTQGLPHGRPGCSELHSQTPSGHFICLHFQLFYFTLLYFILFIYPSIHLSIHPSIHSFIHLFSEPRVSHMPGVSSTTEPHPQAALMFWGYISRLFYPVISQEDTSVAFPALRNRSEALSLEPNCLLWILCPVIPSCGTLAYFSLLGPGVGVLGLEAWGFEPRKSSSTQLWPQPKLLFKPLSWHVP